MQEIAISEFKAKCLALLDEVSRTGEPIIVTRRGVPIAEVKPPPPAVRPKRRLGGMRGSAQILGDIIAPVSSIEEWDAWR